MNRLTRNVPQVRFLALCAIIPFVVCSCENKIRQADELVQKAQYQQAIQMLRDVDSSRTEVKSLLQAAYIGLLTQTIRERQYELAKRILGDLPPAIRRLPEVAVINNRIQQEMKGIFAGIWDGHNASSRATLLSSR